MMNVKTWIPLVLAVVLGLVAMKLARDFLASKNKPGEAKQHLTEWVVAGRHIPAGTALRPDDLKIGKMSGEVAPESAFRSVAQVEGRVVTTALVAGQPVMETLLAPKGTGSGLQALVPRGMRAITLEINEFSGVAGFLVPGCRVDVVSTIHGEGGEMISRTIVQNVQVTALGRRQQQANAADENEPTRSVTLLVKPKEAEAIELAASTGRPRLVLRASGDKDTAKSEGITVAELRGRRKVDPFATPIVDLFRPTQPLSGPSTRPGDVEPVTPVSYEPPARVTRTVKVIRAGVESHVTFELPAEDGQKIMTDAMR